MATSPVLSTQANTGLRSLEDLQKSQGQQASNMDKNTFLQLLVAQLSNQDPMQPADDTEYIAQLAQFSALEQMESLNSTTSTSQAYSLMGKYVYIESGDSSDSYVFGQVDGVNFKDGKPYLIVGNKEYDYNSVSAVLNSLDTGFDQSLISSAQLIGKTVTANVTADGQTTTVTGQVSQIVVKDGAIYAVVTESGTESATHQIPISDIQQIQS